MPYKRFAQREPADTMAFDALTLEFEDAAAARSEPLDEPLEVLEPPEVSLGHVAAGGLSPAIMAIVERGVRRRPLDAHSLRAEIELMMDEGYPPVRIVFGEAQVLVEDGPGVAPDLRVRGSLPDLISLMMAPLVGGVPVPINARGRGVLALVAARRVRLRGRIGVMRRLLTVIRV